MQTASLSKISRISRAIICLFILVALTGASAQMASARAVLDFDGDGKTDYLVWRMPDHVAPNSPLDWYISLSSGGSMAQQFGFYPFTATGDRPMPEDYDGDGKCDLAVYRYTGNPLVLYYLSSEANTVQARVLDGFFNLEMTQDYDGDGKADPAETVSDNGNLIWKIMESRTGNLRTVHFGRSAWDTRIRGDYDGDGKADIAVYRHTGTPANTFFVLRSSDNSVQSMTFGSAQTDFIISADFDGDRKTDFAVWRGRASAVADGAWYWIESSTGVFRSLYYGIGNRDYPIPGDYDGDGKTDQAVTRYENDPEAPFGKLIFYVNQSTGGMTAMHWGNGYDFPAGGIYAR
jgi:hypothetical protein